MAHIALVGVAIAVASRSLCQLWDNVVGHYTTLRTSHRLTRCVRRRPAPAAAAWSSPILCRGMSSHLLCIRTPMRA